jgi:hypothetical protein
VGQAVTVSPPGLLDGYKMATTGPTVQKVIVRTIQDLPHKLVRWLGCDGQPDTTAAFVSSRILVAATGPKHIGEHEVNHDDPRDEHEYVCDRDSNV